MAEVSQFLYQLGELSGETIFIDGTKIEACANKYTFVWKKAVSKNLGKRLEKLAAFVELCEETYGIKVVYQNQMKMKHVKKLHICGTRNSYSKTDHDATFMRMKEDAMGNGQLKAGYNLQHGVDSEYISWLTLGSQPADTYTCHNWKKSHKESIKKEKTRTGYERETTVYICQECGGCPYKKECIKGNHCKTPLEDRNKNLYVSKKLLEYREADLERIESEEGIKLRMNRSIQVEGSFGELKQNSGFRRFLCRGSQNVKAEAILLAFAHNINKLHHKIQGDRTGNPCLL